MTYWSTGEEGGELVLAEKAGPRSLGGRRCLRKPGQGSWDLSPGWWPAQAANCCPHRPVTPHSCFHVTLWPLTWMYPMQSLTRKLIHHSEVLTKQAILSPAPAYVKIKVTSPSLPRLPQKSRDVGNSYSGQMDQKGRQYLQLH